MRARTFRKGVRLRTKSVQHTCSYMSILTQEPGRFLPAESCALVVHSLQISSCTAEHRGLLGFPGVEIDKTYLSYWKDQEGGGITGHDWIFIL